MTQTVVDAEVQVFQVGNAGSTPDFTVPGVVLEQVEISERTGGLLDTGTIDARQQHGTPPDLSTVSPGDRVAFRVQFPSDSGLMDRWSGLVGPTTYQEDGAGLVNWSFEVTDFVFGVADQRTVYASFDAAPIAGSSDAILNRLIDKAAPEINTSQIASITDPYTTTFEGVTLLTAIRELADEADAHVAQDGTSLIFEPIASISAQWSLAESDRSTMAVETNDDRITNKLRVEGGTGLQKDDSQETQAATQTVTSSSRILYRLDTSKAVIPAIDVFTSTTGTSEPVTVRLQADDGTGSPREVSNTDRDIANATVPAGDLTDDGFTRFTMQPREHSTYNPDPWLLIEAGGSAGQDIGTDGNGAPTFTQFYGFPLASVRKDQPSINSYRRRDGDYRDESLLTRAQSDDVAEAVLRHRADPERVAAFEATSKRAHTLSPGEAIEIDEPQANVSDVAVVLEREQTYAGSRNELTTSFKLQDVSSI